MKELYVNICKKTRMVNLPKQFIAVDGENLQNRLVFKFEDEFVDGIARLEYELDERKKYILLEKKDESYFIDVKNILTKNGQINMQLVITENSVDDEIPVFKSNIFYLYCNASINAVEEAPEGYELWIETANAKLNEVENVDIDMVDTTITITRRDGTQKSVIVEGKPGVTPNIEVGETKTLAPTQMALVTRMGTDENPIFEFSIPRGKDGRDGKDGGVTTDEVQEIVDNALENFESGTTVEEVQEIVNNSLENFEAGISLDDVKTITGELENLLTEDKTNLVNAINEVFNGLGSSSGGGETVGVYPLTADADIRSGLGGLYVNTGTSNITVTIAKNGTDPTIYLRPNEIILKTSFYNSGAFQVYPIYVTFGMKTIDIYYVNVATGTKRSFDLSTFLNSTDAQTISGVKTFTTLPESSVTPTTDNQFTNKSYVDTAILNAIGTALGGEY